MLNPYNQHDHPHQVNLRAKADETAHKLLAVLEAFAAYPELTDPRNLRTTGARLEYANNFVHEIGIRLAELISQREDFSGDFHAACVGMCKVMCRAISHVEPCGRPLVLVEFQNDGDRFGTDFIVESQTYNGSGQIERMGLSCWEAFWEASNSPEEVGRMVAELLRQLQRGARGAGLSLPYSFHLKEAKRNRISLKSWVGKTANLSFPCSDDASVEYKVNAVVKVESLRRGRFNLRTPTGLIRDAVFWAIKMEDEK